jgi:hypothetical protein
VTFEISLSYESGRWRARGLGLDVAHEELRSLEALVEARLGERGERAAVLRFDTASLPVWMRQYGAHYFNYTLRLAPQGNYTPPLAPHANHPPRLAPQAGQTLQR